MIEWIERDCDKHQIEPRLAMVYLLPLVIYRLAGVFHPPQLTLL